MSDPFDEVPARVTPYVAMDAPNQPILVQAGPFRLAGAGEGTLESDLTFRWIPSTAVEFEGISSLGRVDLDAEWTLNSDDPRFEIPVFVTSTTLFDTPTRVRGIIREPLKLGDGPFQVLRFSLANFPDYNGAPVSYELGESRGAMRGRLQVSADAGECRVDLIPESKDSRKATKREPGFVVSHVGEWLPSSGQMTTSQAEDVLDMLHFWFGFLRGAWSGPLFPQGLVDRKVMWRRFAAWNLGDSRPVATWLPEHKPLDLSAMFTGFQARWNDQAWNDPLRLAIAWFVDANAPGTAIESRVILAQVALELLALVHLVETQQLHTRTAFDKLTAAERIRILLQDIGVPTEIPDYMTNLPALRQDAADDGPCVVTRVRNALVHQKESKRAFVGSLDGATWYECTQLALQYVELVLLAVCGHEGHYARRAWRGVKGPDEVRVPWSKVGD